MLQVVPALETGGVERGTVEIAEAITREGATALVASAGGRMVGALRRAGGEHIELALDTKNPVGIWRNAARLTTVIGARSVSIVHARSRAPAWSAWLACRRTGVHFVTTYHGVYREDLPGKRRYNAVMAAGERVIAISRHVAQHILQHHHIDPARLRVIPRGVDPVLFDPDAVVGERMMRLARDWRLPDGAPVVMLPGRLTRWKGQEVLLQAMARIARQDAVCVLVGSDQGRRRYSAALLDQARRLGIAERLRFAGQCDDMPAALALADAVVHASIDAEPFGRVVIEAQAMRRPVIATDLGGPVETIAEGETGWRVPPARPDALAAVLDHVLGLPSNECAALGERARAAVLAGYTTRAMQDATLAVYAELPA